ncbi:MAG: hypothetical protein P8Q53_02515 [Flavobacteriaceae bacterium]|nr:hypothetical protein [Flavobacteriaceae bacterium]MDG2276232.1 hypothetical protein [Flavobacteriaceae bacterium]
MNEGLADTSKEFILSKLNYSLKPQATTSFIYNSFLEQRYGITGKYVFSQSY